MVEIAWATKALRLRFASGDTAPVALLSLRPADHPDPGPVDAADRQPLVELTTTDHGRFPGGFRHVDSTIGARLRHVEHRTDRDGPIHELRIVQEDPGTGLRVVSVFRAHEEV